MADGWHVQDCHDNKVHLLTAGVHKISLVARNGNCTDTNGYYPYYIDPVAITGDEQGNLYLVNPALDRGCMVTSLDAAGNVRWCKYLKVGPNRDPVRPDYVSNPFGVVCFSGKLYITGGITDRNAYFDFLTRLDATTGSLEWQRGYKNLLHPGSKSFDQISTYGNLLMVAGTDGGGQGVFLIDTLGNLRKTIKATFYSSYAPHVTKAKADQQGNIYIMQWTEATLNLQPYYYYYTNFVKIDTSLNKYWGIVYPKMNAGDMAVSTHDFGALGSDVGLESSAFLPSFDMRFLKVHTGVNSLAADQNNYCNFNTSDFTLTTMPMTTVAFDWGIDSALSVTAQPVGFYKAVDAHIQSRYTCPDFVDSCQFLKLSGPVSGCSYGNTYTYQIHRNRKCALLPQWKLPQGATIRSQTDSTITVQFPGFGVFGIACEIKSCVPVFDSLTVVIKSKNYRLDLGKDTVLCNQTSLKLHAGSSFLSYQWQDGSHDSTFTVVQPGLYWVQVTDSCGNPLRDSILITPYAANQITLGPDRTRCNDDTLHLNAPPGFLNYTWSNNYNISSITSQTVVVNPLVDTAYYIRAEKMPGCFAYDTVRITVHHSPAIDLGSDKSFCSGDSTVFDAGTGFNQYLWNNGNTSRQITVTTPGIYSVRGTTIQGCKSYGTVKVHTVFANPVVRLDHNNTLCLGSSRVLDAGPFSSYTWTDGSSSRTLSVNNLGIYAVEVQDANGCKGSDTTVIMEFLPLPENFLPADTAICSYGSLTLKPTRTYTSYLWSNNASASAITITQPGEYWLKVEDINGCKGSDTIRVHPKDCMQGFYIPTAFTPDGDGKNDLFRPLLFGQVKKYSFTIYNRWGQVVFQTSELVKGWNGVFAGTKQDSNVFAWTCTYQLEGQEAKTEKGTVMLIR